MIALTQKDILAHEAAVPWSERYQVEQDLLLCLAMRAIFEDRFLSSQVAMRGGTVLHKVHLAPAARYSEDIDLVAVGERPEGHIRKAILRVLRPVLGREVLSLGLRSARRPECSETVEDLALHLQDPERQEPGRALTIEVEVNVTERTPYLPVQRLPFAIAFRGAQLETELVSYNINEMLATKMRAFFQRKKGRDLFDLYWALSTQSVLPVQSVKYSVPLTTTCRRKGRRWRGRSSSRICASALATGLVSVPTWSRSCEATSPTNPMLPAHSCSRTCSRYSRSDLRKKK